MGSKSSGLNSLAIAACRGLAADNDQVELILSLVFGNCARCTIFGTISGFYDVSIEKLRCRNARLRLPKITGKTCSSMWKQGS